MKNTPSALSASSTPPSVTTPATASASAPALRVVRVVAAATDRSEELDRDALAEIDVVDAEIEEEVHQRRGDAEDRSAGEVTARPAIEPRRDRQQRDRRPHHAEPGDGLRFDLVEQRHRDAAPMYCEIAESRNSASGGAVARVCSTPQSLVTARSVEELWVGAADLLPERLEREPAGQRVADLLVRVLGVLGLDLLGSASRHRASRAWHERSIVMNQNAASSTDSPTVKSPWFWWIAACPSGTWRRTLPASTSNTTAPLLLGDDRVVLVEVARALWIGASGMPSELNALP